MDLHNSDNTIEKKKKTYSAPDLVEYGKLGEATQGPGANINDYPLSGGEY